MLIWSHFLQYLFSGQSQITKELKNLWKYRNSSRIKERESKIPLLCVMARPQVMAAGSFHNLWQYPASLIGCFAWRSLCFLNNLCHVFHFHCLHHLISRVVIPVSLIHLHFRPHYLHGLQRVACSWHGVAILKALSWVSAICFCKLVQMGVGGSRAHGGGSRLSW